MSKTRDTADLPGSRLTALEAAFAQLHAALGASGGLPHHEVTDLVTAAAATDEATSVALANDLKAQYNAHIADTDAHVAADATNPTAAADATDLATVITLANEAKGDLNAHIVLTASHRGAGGAGGVGGQTVTTADGTDQTTANALCNALKAAMNRHFSAGAPDIALVAS
jgi:hypothetical protein